MAFYLAVGVFVFGIFVLPLLAMFAEVLLEERDSRVR